MATPGSMQKMAAEIFSDMVMEEAIRDKTIQVKQQMKDQEGTFHAPHAAGDDCCAVGNAFHQGEGGHASEDDELEGLDDEEEKIMREIREHRMAEMKSSYQEVQENKIKGHGQYREITEQEFLPTVTSSKSVVCHFYHKDFERCKIVDMHLREIAKAHVEAKFVFLNAEKAPFFI